jgi:hypothetical protein
MFYILYIVLELPSSIACKWIGPGWFLPLLTLGFRSASVATAFAYINAQMYGVGFVSGRLGKS